MIIVRLMGGLGNQMFQYATGRALAVRRGVPLRLDVSAYAQYPLRGYRLDRFRIRASVASTREVAAVAAGGGGLRHRLLRAIDRRRPRYRRRIIREPHFHYDPDLHRAGRSAYLVGFWQSEKYFREIRELLLEELRVDEPPDATNRRVLDAIAATDSISLHVRRGDYVADPANLRFYGSCTPQYYREALEAVLPGLADPHVFVFSDDIAWARTNLALPCPSTFVDHNGEAADHQDMRLMSHCKHHVIANSTFSWWGAWLGGSPEKRIVAPRRWYADPAVNTTDVIPDGWARR